MARFGEKAFVFYFACPVVSGRPSLFASLRDVFACDESTFESVQPPKES